MRLELAPKFYPILSSPQRLDWTGWAVGATGAAAERWYRAVHVKNIDMQKMRSLLANRRLLKRKLIDI